MSKDSAYADAGVNLEAGARAIELMKASVEATHGPRVLAGVGAFGGLFDAADLAAHPVLVASTDGVGTKTKVASAMGMYGGVGHDIVNHCINDILVQGARPLFFLDYVAANQLVPETVAAIVSGCAEACKATGVALLGGETAEMPGVYAPGEFDLVGTVVGVVDRGRIIDGSRIAPGDGIVALPSSGLHTNGFSLARKVFEGADLQATPEGLERPLGEALLEPHRCYANPVFSLLESGVDIKGLAHITGGGIVGNVPRILPEHTAAVIDSASWDPPALFHVIEERGNIARDEMFDVFNMGVGLMAFVPQEQVDSVVQAVEGAWLAGRIEEGTRGVILS